MFKTIDQPADCEIRSVIQFLTAKNVSVAEIHRQISDVYGPNVMSSSKVRKWVRAFKDGRENVHDEPHSDRPSVITDDLVNTVDEKIREDRRFTISTSALEFPNVGRTTLHKVVSEKLKFRKLCAHWVPRLLTEEHKLKKMACALDFLDRYHKEGDQFLERIVTGDETWVSHITQSLNVSQWHGVTQIHQSESRPSGQSQHARSFGWEQIDHPPYSPDLAPSDFHLFRYLKEFLGGKRFDTADEVKEEVQDWLSSQAADVYDLGIQKFVERYDKCLSKYGEYVEK
ncbi:HTH_48 domain-containing protein [Trichonephila clavipes]|nr:HTH_48 domain-containing protein [Trichonephila clavipes]